MSGRDENNATTPKQLTSLSTETLEDMLRWYTLAEDNVSENSISEIINELKSREEGDVEPDFAQAMNDFFEIYANEDIEYGNGQSSKEAEVVSNFQNTRPMRRRVGKITAVLAAIVAIVITTSLVAYAAGYDIFKAVATWTQEIFAFTSESSEQLDSPLLQSTVPEQLEDFRQLLIDNGITESVLPSYLPEGLETTDMTTSSNETYSSYSCALSSQTDFVVIYVVEYNDGATYLSEYQLENADVEEIIKGNIHYYCFSNSDTYTVAWINCNVECYISGIGLHDDAMKIIDSFEV